MKVLITLGGLLMISGCATLNFDWGEVVPTDKRQQQLIANLDSMTQSEIYHKSLEWMVYTFKDSESVIELKNEEQGKIMGKYVEGNVQVDGMNATYLCRYTLVIETKDNKARVIVRDPYMISAYNSYTGTVASNSPIDKEVFINSLKENQWFNLLKDYRYFMSKTKNDNW